MPQKNFELLKNSDPAALQNIHSKYRRLIFWVGRQIIDDDFVVENIMQDTFFKLWEYREKIERPMHILFFLKFVMKRSCYSHYSKPRNKFFRTTVRSFESYENYRNYMAGYDPADAVQDLLDQQTQQRYFDLVNRVLPMISPKKRQLINLCLKYDFRYKDIAEAMGKGTTEIANEVRRAIDDIKAIVDHNNVLEGNLKESASAKVQDQVSERQTAVLKLRYEKKFSFAAIASELNISQKEVHDEFMVGYKFMQQQQKTL